MIQFSDFKVRSFDLDHLDLFWEVMETPSSVDGWDIFVLKSVDGAGGPFRVIAGPFTNTNQIRDPEVNLLHNWRTYYYKLRAVRQSDGEQTEVGPTWLQADPDLITIELRRRFNLLMQEFAGRKVLVFPAITAGFRCPHCFDRGTNTRGRTTSRQRTQNCETCYDTSFLGGFAQPIATYAQSDPEQKSIVRTDTAETSPTDGTARLSFFPPLKPKDMIVEAENIRWEVQSVSGTKKLRAQVHQEPILHQIPKGDIRYKIPINLSLLEQFGPEREYTRPMSLGSEIKTPLTDMLDSLLGDS